MYFSKVSQNKVFFTWFVFAKLICPKRPLIGCTTSLLANELPRHNATYAAGGAAAGDGVDSGLILLLALPKCTKSSKK
jgi:hypothetical protein